MSYSPSSRHEDTDSLAAYQAVDFDSTYNNRHEFNRTPMAAPADIESEQAATETDLVSEQTHRLWETMPDTAAGLTKPASQRFDPHQTWRSVIDELALSLDPAVYNSFVRDTWVIAYEDGEFIIGLPNAYAHDWVSSRLKNTITRKLHSHMKRSVQTTFRVQSPKVVEGAEELASMPLYQVAQSTARDQERHADGTTTVTARSHPPKAEVRDVPMALHSRYSSLLKSEYTFDTFVVGDHNRLAHAAGSAVSQNPGERYNPFFVYGGVGLGKTHLLHAIGNRAQARGDVVLYCSSEQFTNELINAIVNRTTNEFREKYRQVDVLLIDDIQFLGGKERTQEEFFHTFNHLHAAGGQVVLTSDRQPKALGDLEERLRSRFEGGLQADIQPPDFETRVAILQQKAQLLNIPIEREALMFVAERVDSNIRELEGALNHLHLQSQMLNSPLSYSLAVQLMDNLAPQRTPCHPADVVRIVALHFNLTLDDLTGSVRSQPIAHARQIAMYLLREENELSYPQIGRELGGRDHSTIRYGVGKVANQVAASSAKGEALRTELAKLRDRIYMPYVR